MASGDKDLSNHVCSGTETGTGSLITVLCGFKPKAVWLYNVTGEAVLHWSSKMADGKGYKGNGLATGTNAAESSHTHAVALDSGVSDATSGGTPAGTNSTSAVTGTAAGVCTPEGTVNVSATAHEFGNQTLYDIQGSGNTDAENADENADVTNGAAVAVDATVAAGTWTVGAITSPAVPRNVCISIQNPTGGALALYEGVSTFTVDGTDRFGAALQELITVTSNAGNKSMAAAKFRVKYGVKAFKTVTGVTLDNAPANDLVISVGLGSKIAILNTLRTPAEADVIRATINVTNYAFSGKVDTTNNTLNYGTLSDGDDVSVVSAMTTGTAYTFTGNAASVATMSTLSGTAAAQTFTGSALATHTHGPGTLADAVSGAGSSHNHAFTGGAADQAFIASGGVTPLYNGFTIGTDADINVNAEVINWVAFK